MLPCGLPANVPLTAPGLVLLRITKVPPTGRSAGGRTARSPLSVMKPATLSTLVVALEPEPVNWILNVPLLSRLRSPETFTVFVKEAVPWDKVRLEEAFASVTVPVVVPVIC